MKWSGGKNDRDAVGIENVRMLPPNGVIEGPGDSPGLDSIGYHKLLTLFTPRTSDSLYDLTDGTC